jgi:hypothetical protein
MPPNDKVSLTLALHETGALSVKETAQMIASLITSENAQANTVRFPSDLAQELKSLITQGKGS